MLFSVNVMFQPPEVKLYKRRTFKNHLIIMLLLQLWKGNLKKKGKLNIFSANHLIILALKNKNKNTLLMIIELKGIVYYQYLYNVVFKDFLKRRFYFFIQIS